MSARWRRAIFSNPIRMSGARTHGVSGRLPHRALRRCATTGEAEESAEEEVRRADPLSVNPGPRPGLEWRGRYAPQGGAAVDAVPESASGDASAAHQRRADIPRRCRGLTESVTARAVGFRTTARDDEVRRARSGSAITAIGDVVCRARSDSATTAIGDEVRRARSGSATTAIGDEVRRARSDSASGGVAHL